MAPNLVGKIALWGYVPFVLLVFALMRNRRHAVLVGFLVGWEFLPMDSIKLPIMELNKVTACSCGVFLAVCVFDAKRLLTFRPRWYDIPMLVWCICPFITSWQNNLGAYDGASAMAQQTVLWGLPYYLGRVYFSDFEGLRELCMGMFIAALVYVPFCLWEIKMSPQLHKIVYGHFQHDFAMTIRFGGFRPMVFMQHGIALGMWMCVSLMAGAWLWWSGTVNKLFGMPMAVWVVGMFATDMLIKSTGALLLMFAGMGALYWIRYVRNALPLYLLIFSCPIYMYLRASGTWDAKNLIDMAQRSFGEERAQSLETRINAENELTAKAVEPTPSDDWSPDHNPWFGFGRWSPLVLYGQAPWRVGHIAIGTNHETHEEFHYFKDEAPTDGMWIITLGELGYLGLGSATIAIMLPALLIRRRLPLVAWSHPIAAPAAVLAVILVLHMLDNLLNAMLNPIFVLAIGGLSALGTSGVKRPAGQRVPAPTPSTLAPGPFPAIGGLAMPAIPFPPRPQEPATGAWPAPPAFGRMRGGRGPM